MVRFEKDTKKISEGIILTTPQFAKGLEFDQVILPDIRSDQLGKKVISYTLAVLVRCMN